MTIITLSFVGFALQISCRRNSDINYNILMMRRLNEVMQRSLHQNEGNIDSKLYISTKTATTLYSSTSSSNQDPLTGHHFNKTLQKIHQRKSPSIEPLSLSNIKSSTFLFGAHTPDKTQISVKIAQQKQKVADIMHKYSIVKQKIDKRLKKSWIDTQTGKKDKNKKQTEQYSIIVNDSSTNSSMLLKRQSKIQKLIFVNTAGKGQGFRIIKYISEGASGKVYLAQNIFSGLVCSIKVIPKEKIPTEYLYQLIRQIKIQSYLSHPNIVKLYNHYIDQKNIYLIMEPCLGQDLYKNLTKEKVGMDEKEVKKIIKQVCKAVEYMHLNDIIHRDLKLENILLHEGTVKICDFGWAVHSPIMRNTMCGTPVYSSPEMIMNEMYDNKVDIWNIGILTYQLLYGNIPFEVRQLSQLRNIIEQEVFFSKNVNISRSGKSFINKCLDKNPGTRLNIKQVLQHEFMSKRYNYRNTVY